MGRVLVVTHSADERDAVLWKTVLSNFQNVDIVFPRFKNNETDAQWIRPMEDENRAFLLPAREPFGKGHSSLWVSGLRERLQTGDYALLHAAMEPWSLIPQFFVERIPTVVQGAESIVVTAPWQLRLRRVGLRRVLRNLAGLSAWGQTSIDAFVEAGLPASTPRAVIPMGIPDPAVFTRTSVPDLEAVLNILYVGRLDPEKGVSTIIQALKLMPTNIRIHLKILGSGAIERQLKTMAIDLATAQIDFEGEASLSDVQTALQWSHVVVVPSLVTNCWMEQWGRVSVEPILSGRPCLISDSGELPSISPISDTIFTAGDSRELAEKLLRLTANVNVLQGIADEQFRYIQRFEASHLADQLNNLWVQSLKPH